MNNLNPYTRGLSPSQVANLLGVKPSTVRSWISRRELKAYKFDNRRYITHEQIKDFQLLRHSGDVIIRTYAKG